MWLTSFSPRVCSPYSLITTWQSYTTATLGSEFYGDIFSFNGSYHSVRFILAAAVTVATATVGDLVIKRVYGQQTLYIQTLKV